MPKEFILLIRKRSLTGLRGKLFSRSCKSQLTKLRILLKVQVDGLISIDEGKIYYLQIIIESKRMTKYCEI